MNNFTKNKKKLSAISRKGFALLYALLLTGAVLSVGVILMNIITKQLIFSSINRSSETSYYYAANSGRECLEYHAALNPQNFYIEYEDSVSFSEQANFACLGNEVSMTRGEIIDGKVTYSLAEPITVDGVSRVNLFVTFNENCILGGGSCDPESSNLEDKNIAVMKAVGFSGASGGSRETSRTAIAVKN